jgi:hypothetical protein
MTAGPLRSALFFGCKRSDDFLEARVAAERVPLGKQSRTGKVRRLFHVFAGKFLLAHPSGDEGEILDHVRPAR